MCNTGWITLQIDLPSGGSAFGPHPATFPQRCANISTSVLFHVMCRWSAFGVHMGRLSEVRVLEETLVYLDCWTQPILFSSRSRNSAKNIFHGNTDPMKWCHLLTYSQWVLSSTNNQISFPDLLNSIFRCMFWLVPRVTKCFKPIFREGAPDWLLLVVNSLPGTTGYSV